MPARPRADAGARAAPPARQKAAEPAQMFVLDGEVAEVLADVAGRAGVSQAGVLELALRRLAHDGARGGGGTLPGAAAGRGPVAEGRRQGVRLSPHAQRLLQELAEARPRYGETRVAVVELAIRRFARFAEREGLLAPSAG